MSFRSRMTISNRERRDAANGRSSQEQPGISIEVGEEHGGNEGCISTSSPTELIDIASFSDEGSEEGKQSRDEGAPEGHDLLANGKW